MKFGEFELSIIRESAFRLDGGAMFGVVPKPVWNKVSPADERNRIPLACNLLLIETGRDRVLVETGMGDRWDERDRDRYELQTKVDFSNVLKDFGLTNDDVTAVIISHLHFDHAGGATRLINGKVVPTFPKAKYFAQKGELEFAHNANARARASYRPDDYEPLISAGQMQLIDGDTEIVPGIWARVTGGHTSHHQVIYFESGGEKGVFFADIIPTKSHITPPWVMGYDHYPLDSCEVKSKWLADAAKENWLVVFDHEAGVPWGHVSVSEAKKFEFTALPEETLNYRKSVVSV
jgi:glyoxylase-like metal-dependent hydrolase (beta-lactamase superfamily II)